jgi:RpiB/LacA/LacB family sugar-phosphate isomerase
MNIVIGADHGGFELKKIIVEDLKKNGHHAEDEGTYSSAAVDYPDYARAVAAAVIDGRGERGIIICGSGVGASVAANKFPGIRAAICHDTFSARQGVEDDDMNILCLGARVVGSELAKELVKTFLAASFSGAVRHVRRLKKIEEIEKEVSGLKKDSLKS